MNVPVGGSGVCITLSGSKDAVLLVDATPESCRGGFITVRVSSPAVLGPPIPLLNRRWWFAIADGKGLMGYSVGSILSRRLDDSIVLRELGWRSSSSSACRLRLLVALVVDGGARRSPPTEDKASKRSLR